MFYNWVVINDNRNMPHSQKEYESIIQLKIKETYSIFCLLQLVLTQHFFSLVDSIGPVTVSLSIFSMFWNWWSSFQKLILHQVFAIVRISSKSGGRVDPMCGVAMLVSEVA